MSFCLYLLPWPACVPAPLQVRAEPLKFREEGVFQVVKDVFLPWYNAYRWAMLLGGRAGVCPAAVCGN